MTPRTQYARSGDLHIAYQVIGEGPFDLVYIPGWVSHVELAWEEPDLARFLGRLASFSRLIVFDKRGTGLSDRVPNDKLPTLEERMDDLRVVMDAVGSERPALFGFSEGGNMAALFAAMHPERTRALVLAHTFAKRIWSPDYPWAPTPEKREAECKFVEREWGNLMDVAHYAPGKVGDLAYVERVATYMRRAASPGAAVALLRMNTQIDIRSILQTIRVPTLVMHRTGDQDVNVEEGRYIAARIPGAKFIELPGDDHLPWIGDQSLFLDEMQEFLTGIRPAPEYERVLATVMFTDIVGSTETAARMGDRDWRDLLGRHHTIARAEIARFRGREVNTSGDGFLATFDGPARAVRCAAAMREALQPLGIAIRAGVHTGEIELDGDDVGGIAVHICARVAAIAATGETLVSSTVKDLVAGAGLRFDDRGAHTLKGVPGEWRLFAAA